MLKKVVLLGSILILSKSVISAELELVSEDYPVFNVVQCYYIATGSGAPKTLDFKGLLGPSVPEYYDGYELLDRRYVINGWASAYHNCDYVDDTYKFINVTNHIPKVDISVYQDTTWQGGETKLIFTAKVDDFENNSIRYQWTLNGVVQKNTSGTLVTTAPGGYKYNVSLKVWDGGVKVYNNDEGYYYNLGYPVLEQQVTKNTSVTVKEWGGCGRDCIIN
ncbi:hypothetical protein [Shewanella sp. cp20]|uniref:hypothetical protein n=1 Tax=Shewanella sp. cp20 TaxID=1521167 RepID=UPI00059F6E2E|nr:hypothetical protein [Shewanella sp. cp20]KIO35610.1 hypothetical protein DB48_15090 [Shewanella sp. cp20]